MSANAKNRAFVSLGSNIDPATNLSRAVELLCEYGDVVAVSSVWRSAPVGDVQQADFFNGAVLLETTLSAVELKQTALARIEQELHRVRDPHNKNAARTIDMDLSLFNNERLTCAGRVIPDEDIVKRPFVALPLAELEPEYVHPVEKTMLREIADRFELSEWGMVRSDEIVLKCT